MAVIVSADMPVEQVVSYLAQGLEAEFDRRVRAELAKVADKVVREVAQSIADDLKKNITSYRSTPDGTINVVLNITPRSDT